jgi:RNA-directed DNA polymerase
VSTDLTRIGERARKQPDLVFTTLYHHVTDLDNLRACYEALDGDKAVGVDGVTKEQYGDSLEGNLREHGDGHDKMHIYEIESVR